MMKSTIRARPVLGASALMLGVPLVARAETRPATSGFDGPRWHP